VLHSRVGRVPLFSSEGPPMSAGLMTRTSGTALSASFSMRHRSLGVFLPDLPPRKAQESPCSTCDDLTGAPRESMHIDRCGRRHRIKGQWLFATLLIGRISLLRLFHRTDSFHPRNAVDHVPFRTGADGLRTGKRPARKGRRCRAHCSFRAAVTSTRHLGCDPSCTRLSPGPRWRR
jgi:hypothetical protein